MLEEIALRFHTDLKGTPLVGDSLKDLQAAEAVGGQPMLVLTGKGAMTRAQGAMPKKTLVFEDLADATRHLTAPA
jgi:D-glycero-D-manno-heptose 1,7-bisphosphate phosphatase